MVAAADFRQRVRDELYSAFPVQRPFAHQVNGAVSSGSDTSIVVDDGDNFAVGDVIEFEEDGDQAFITAISTNTLTVIRSYNGTTGASHADNSVILKNPRFTIQKIDDATTRILQELEGRGIYCYGTGSLTLVASQQWYDLSETDLIPKPGVLALYYADPTTAVPVPLPFKYQDMIHTTVTASGQGIRAWEWGEKTAGDDLYYTYAKRISLTTHLLARQEELVFNGVVGKLALGTNVPYTHDPGRRTDRTIQAGQGGRDAGLYIGQYIDGARAEAAALKSEAKKLPGSVGTRRGQRWQR